MQRKPKIDLYDESGGQMDPFNVSAQCGSGFFYANTDLKQRMDLLHHLLQFGDLPLVLLGRSGSGKTTVMNHVIAEAKEPWRVAVVDTHDELGLEEFLAKTLEGFDIRPPNQDREVLEGLLGEHLNSLYHSAQLGVLFVEDAHTMPTKTLRYIQRLAGARNHTGLQVVFTGEPGLLARLGGDKGSAPIVHQIELNPLSRDEVGNYIRACLQHAGLQQALPLVEEQLVSSIFASSKGLPGLVNKAAQGVFVDPGDGERRNGLVDSPHKTAYLVSLFRRLPAWAMVALILLIPLIYVLARMPSPPPGQKESTIIALPPPQSSAAKATTPSYEPKGPQGEMSDGVNVIPLQLGGAGNSVAGGAQPAVAKEPEPQLPVQPERNMASTPAVVERNAVPESVSGVKAAVPAKTQPKAPPARIDPLTQVRGHDWLKAQSADAFTIQLFGTHDRNSAAQFIHNHKLQKRAAVFKTRHQDDDWFVVVSGVYPDRNSVRAAIKKLPASLRKVGPWSRTFKSIQEGLR